MNLYLQVFSNRRVAVLLLLGFSSGLPLALTFGTLQAWMKDAGVDLAAIGAITLVGLPYTVKYLWAPLMDRYTPPFLGRRRGWLVVTQLTLMAAIVFMGSLNPVSQPWLLAVTAVLVSFLSASQDIVVDAYRADVLREEELGAGAAVSVLGYRLGMLSSGAMALILADHLPWAAVYRIMAGLMLVGVAAALWGTEPKSGGSPRSLAEAVALPFRAFFSRDAALVLLLFIILYKLPDAVAGAMTTPFLLDVGFSKTEIGAVNKGFGLVATIFGAVAAGGLIARLGIYRSLWAFGILQAVTNLTYMGVALAGQNKAALILAVGVDNLSGGMGTAAFVAFLMSLTEKRYSATQYALLSSLMAITPKIAGAPTGLLAAGLGWPMFFAASVLGAVPGLAVLWWLMRRGAIGGRVASPPVAAD
ncbi:AmpG family muropeptide MFS transporter [Candidatus Manganitrophus noduliformans]|uniref:MFS transporter n=1 Tax=Candidatus Manganitrophus noduliformans TaxID=2606439 RepID=A0A7X6DRU4_9BACT|nr:MFS transporter [Candidatus Manganitrophus noduliformans]NKE72222.1 MFS transporter [Candidatus Manganitrophus noduliformans]